MPEDKVYCIDFRIGKWCFSIRSVEPAQKLNAASDLAQRVFSSAITCINPKIHNGDTAIDILFANDKMIQRLNKNYRGKDEPTNVLSFQDYSPGNNFDVRLCPLGSIVISIDMVSKEAQEQSKSVENHLAHLLLHGFLHLLGYTHDCKDDAKIMESLESKILLEIGIADPYGGMIC